MVGFFFAKFVSQGEDAVAQYHICLVKFSLSWTTEEKIEI
jgi:hypothetical protein